MHLHRPTVQAKWMCAVCCKSAGLLQQLVCAVWLMADLSDASHELMCWALMLQDTFHALTARKVNTCNHAFAGCNTI